jgi:basic amino acid/polyamine antiporter, APA family
MNLFVRKPISRIVAESEDATHTLKKTLGPKSLIGLGIGAIIGAGIFSLTGIAAAENAGPAVLFSFMVAALACAFAGMCYSELAAMIPVAGSAYTYAYATMGEFIAWIIGWDLVLEYAVASSVVAVSWSRYVMSFLGGFGITLPTQFSACPFDPTPGIINIPAMLIVMAISFLLMVGIKESANVNTVIVIIKVAVVLTFIGVGLYYIKPENYQPFIPENTGKFGEFGISGIMRAAGIIFFAYIGFDSVSTAAQESRKPARDIPIGILGSLLICTIIYLAFAFVLTGMVNYKDMRGDAAPVATAIGLTSYPWLKSIITFGAIAGLTSVILVMLLGQSRVFYSMSRDGLLPKVFSDIHPKWKTPWKSNLIFMIIVGLGAGLLPISQLGHMTSIGTLMAFVLVCAGVLVLRYLHPEYTRPYRVPLVPLFPILGIIVCLLMMLSLDGTTWLRLGIWLVIGMVVYFLYGRHHSRLNEK